MLVILYFMMYPKDELFLPSKLGNTMSVGVRRPRDSLRYHRGPVTALEAQQPFGCATISTRCEFLSFASPNDRPSNNGLIE